MRRPRRLTLEQLGPYLLNVGQSRERERPGFEIPVAYAPGSDEQLNWPAIFANANTVEIEVGFGKGLFLVTSAETRPETNFLGLEVLRKLQLFTATRLAKRNLHNARVACADARSFFRDRIATASVEAVHVYFPDPWWKTRHAKRRVWTPEFAAVCVRVLRPGGRLHIATDVGDYYTVIRELLDGLAGLKLVTAYERTGPPEAGEVLTNFERKARQTGGAVWRAEFERI